MPLTRLACNQRLRWDRQLCWLRSDSTMQQDWCIVQFKEFIAVIDNERVAIAKACTRSHYAGTNL